MRARKPLRMWYVCALMLTVQACDSGTAPASIGLAEPVAESNGQLAAVGAVLPVPVALSLVDEAGRPRAGVSVSFAADTGSGSVSPTTVTTGADGVARTSWTLGTRIGLQRVLATVQGIDPVAFFARALPGQAATLAIVRTDSGAVLSVGRTASLRIASADRYGNVISGRAPTWRSLDPEIVSVNGAGIATGVAPGRGRVVASLDQVADTLALHVETAVDHRGFLGIAAGGEDVPEASVLEGGSFTCGVRVGGAIHCWGYNLRGQLGNGSIVPTATPVSVRSPAGVHFSMVRAGRGGSHLTCALAVDGDIHCWGRSALGSAPLRQSGVPVPVIAPAGVRFDHLAVGANHACGATTTGTVYCWGEGGGGRLGDGNTVDSPAPVPVALPPEERVVRLAATATSTCAVTASGAVHCWGENGSGQLGNGQQASSSSPTRIVGVDGVRFVGIGAGVSHFCAIAEAGDVYCWGRNQGGQLGTGTSGGSSRTPSRVTGLDGSRIVDVTGGSGHSCAVTADGHVRCWGDNASGQLGVGSRTASLTPVPIAAPDIVRFGGVSAGGAHTCAFTEAGEAYCWGKNQHGQLGTGITTDATSPARVVEGN